MLMGDSRRDSGKVSILTVIGTAVVGSAAAILIGLAAVPRPQASAEAKVDAALALYGRGDRDAARSAAESLVHTDPHEVRAWLLLGMLEEDRKAYAEAKSAYEHALGLLATDDVRHVDVQITLADLLRRKGDPRAP